MQRTLKFWGRKGKGCWVEERKMNRQKKEGEEARVSQVGQSTVREREREPSEFRRQWTGPSYLGEWWVVATAFFVVCPAAIKREEGEGSRGWHLTLGVCYISCFGSFKMKFGARVFTVRSEITPVTDARGSIKGRRKKVNNWALCPVCSPYSS